MAPSLTQQQKLVHFLNRTSFGPTREELEKLQQSGIAAYLDQQLSPDQIPDSVVVDRVAELKTMRLSSRELLELYPQAAVAQAKGMDMAQMQGPRQVILELQLARLIRAIYSRRQLYEVMVDFWSNHFNIFAGKGADRWLSTSYDRDTIRPNALGRFKDLLTATAQSPAMLFYLDNWMSVHPQSPAAQRGPNNRRRGINENYAREVMELHTLGVESRGGNREPDSWTVPLARLPRAPARCQRDRTWSGNSRPRPPHRRRRLPLAPRRDHGPWRRRRWLGHGRGNPRNPTRGQTPHVAVRLLQRSPLATRNDAAIGDMTLANRHPLPAGG
jgi:hypothetical protein